MLDDLRAAICAAVREFKRRRWARRNAKRFGIGLPF